MEYAKLGHTGLEVSRLCLGCMGFGDADRWIHKWVLDEEHSHPIIKHALDRALMSAGHSPTWGSARRRP